MVKVVSLSRVIILSFSALITLNANAALPGIYLGGQAGWGYVNDSGISQQDMGDLITSALNYSNFTINTISGTTSGGGLAGRVFGGYQFGCNLAVEFGWTKFNSLPVKATASGNDLQTGDNFVASTSGTLKVDAFDLVAKGIMPLRYGFNVYGKLGMAYLESKSNASAVVTEPSLTNASASNMDNTNRFFPTFGIGIALDVRPDIEWDLSYNRIQKIGHSEELGSTDFISLGLLFHFDKWGVYN